MSSRYAVQRWALPLTLLALVGFNLRTVLLGVPPVLPLIERDLGLNHTNLGLLAALPVLTMGAGALPGGFLTARLGGRTIVALGLALLALGGALRALDAGIIALYAFTLVFSLGIAITQPAVVTLIRQWFPERIGLASALYIDGLIAGEAVAAGSTIPLLRLLPPDGWRESFIFWSLLVVPMLLVWLVLAPRRPAHDQVERGQTFAEEDVTDHRPGRPQFWLLGLRLGCLSGACSLIYFDMNAWIASYDAALGRPGAAALSLALLNGAQLPVCLGLTGAAQRLAGTKAPFVLSGILCLGAIAGWVATPFGLQPLWAIILGGSSVAVLMFGTALPPLYASRSSVAPLAGLTLTVSYVVSFLGQVAGGRLWDLSGLPAFSFLPVAIASLALIVLGASLPPIPSRRPAASQTTRA